MRKNTLFKILNCNTFVLGIAVFSFFLNTENGYAQNYRNARAYINDFGKNELFVKESLMEYSTAIIDASPDNRIQSTLERLYTKLENINVNLLRNDIGFAGDTELRNAFMNLNSKTITLLKNKSLKLNDYNIQSALDYADIFRNFAYKELEITNYYGEILKYENQKREFGLKYNIVIRSFNKKNVFEYDAYQNLIFYKLNVLDDKLISFLKEKDTDAVQKCMDYLVEIGHESLLKTELYRDDFVDTSLNDANIEMINFMMDQKEIVLPLYELYVKTSNEFQEIKTRFNSNKSNITVEEYNAQVRRYNSVKNNFFDALYENQVKKRSLVNHWYMINSDFLRRNIEFENLYEKFSNVD